MACRAASVKAADTDDHHASRGPRGERGAQDRSLPSSVAAARSADARFQEVASRLGYSFDGELKVGGNYVPLVRDGNVLYVSGQVPRVGSTVVVTGRVGVGVGVDVDLGRAQLAARVCAMRALALLQRELGSLDRVRQVLRVVVYTQSAADFTLQSEVADAASELLHTILGEAGRHARTSVGVYQLPKNASVELDLVASARPGRVGGSGAAAGRRDDA